MNQPNLVLDPRPKCVIKKTIENLPWDNGITGTNLRYNIFLGNIF